MQNDDKRTSRDDETFPHEAEADAVHDDDLASPETPPEAAAEPSEDMAKTISFPKNVHISSQGPLEPTFGMPDFDFPEEPKSSARDAEEEAENDMLAARETHDLPIETGTGWESVSSIERPESLRSRRSRRDEAPEATLSSFGDASASMTQRSQATVMPFPGVGFSRSNEPTPVDMLRGSGANSNSLDDFASDAEEQAEPTPEFDAAAQDTLADAVQSALRNVYGGQVSERPDDNAEQGGYTVADTLMGGTSSRERGGESLWPEASPGWQQPEGNDEYLETERQRGAVETNTEAVLDYLYGQRRAEKREATVLSADSSLRDFGEATGYSRDWQDTRDFDDRQPPQQSLRDLGGIYRGGPQQRYVEQGDRAFLRDSEMAYRPGMPGGGDADWGQPTYLSHPPTHLASGQAYPAHLPSAAPDSLSSGSPDSGHLLGAAGLGLIGGIALAGVLAVFVFNSFVDESDPTATDTTPKVVERLTPPAAESVPPVRVEVPVQAKSAPAQPAAAVPPVVRPAPTPAETPRQVVQPQPEPQPQSAEPSGQKLAARDANGAADGPIKLDIRVAEASDKEESLISLKGLPPEARLSTGIDVGGGQWLLPPARLKDLTVTLPKGTTGEFGLEVQLLKDDAQTSLSDPVSFDLRVTPKRQEGAVVSPSSTAAAPAGTEQASRLAVLPDETPQIETDFLTQMLIRDGNRLMRDGDIASARRLYEQAAANGNPEAALAMGRSYDPSYFEKLPVKTGKPDPATAFEWYKKALEGGLVTARVKIDALKQWLQR
jgi:hypothetical protein